MVYSKEYTSLTIDKGAVVDVDADSNNDIYTYDMLDSYHRLR